MATARVLIGLLLLAGPAAAQTSKPAAAGDAAARERAAAFLQKQSFDKTLLGTTRLGMYHRTKNFGSLTVTVEAAPKGSKAAYRVVSKVVIKLGGSGAKMEETALLGVGFDLVRLDGVQTSGGEGQKKSIRREQGKWVYAGEMQSGPRLSKHSDAITGGVDHAEMASLILLGRALAKATPGHYLLRGVKWPRLTANGWMGGKRPSWDEIDVRVGKPTAWTIRGKSHTLVPVKTSQRKDPSEAQTILVDAQGRFYGMQNEHMPLSMLAGTEAEVAADLPKDPAEGAVRDTMRVWFEVVCGKKQASALDPVTDWAALAATRRKADPSLKAKTVMEIAAAEKKRLLAHPLPEKALKVVTSEELAVQVRGELARVSFDTPHKRYVWRLIKAGKAWKLTDFPHEIR